MTKNQTSKQVIEQATLHQNNASNPKQSVWVNANAGSGKTKVLTDRILRLLMNGTPPEKILCITYTRVGASEMVDRINNRLRTWATQPETDLNTELTELLGDGITPNHITTARQLFARVLNTRGGLKIQTIHSLCQSLLKQFPIESNTMIGFSVMDSATALNIRTKTMADTVEYMLENHADHMNTISQFLERETLTALCENMQYYGETPEQTLTHRLKNLPAMVEQIYESLDIKSTTNPDDSTAEFLASLDENILQSVLATLSASPLKSIKESKELLEKWLVQNPNARVENIDQLRLAFLTKEYTIRASNKIFKEDPEFLDIAKQILDYYAQLSRHQIATITQSLLVFGKQYLSTYAQYKEQHGVLEFRDMELKTLALLQKSSTMHQWVMLKMDNGINHIMVDEAQDTSPLQWKIIDHLIQGFYDHEHCPDAPRTIFAVGDFKQSIYSFQGAKPDEFIANRDMYLGKVESANGTFTDVPMQTSFRSTPAILDYVDAVFAGDTAQNGVDLTGTVTHTASRPHSGKIEIWPLVPRPTENEKEQYEENQNQSPNPQEQLATELAKWVANSIGEHAQNPIYLPSKQRYAQAGDFLFLVRKRNNFVKHLILKLNKYNVPVAGQDRLVITDHIAVQDILAICKFVLYPNDDLNLACVLKSPFVGWDEDGKDESLFQLSYTRSKKSLWEKIQSDKKHETLCNWLLKLLNCADSIPPYEFLQVVLNQPCTAVYDSTPPQSGWQALHRRLGTDADDPVSELVTMALDFEQSGVASLQRFVHHMQTLNPDIKRETKPDNNAVSIMTVHGAKGLESPIVILPMTAENNDSDTGQPKNFLYTPNHIPLYPTGKPIPQIITHIKDANKHAQQQEKNRLLYVALTRAEDRVVITGIAPKQGNESKGENPYNDGCWYDLCVQGWEHMKKTGCDRVTTMPFFPYQDTDEILPWTGDKYIIDYGTTALTKTKDTQEQHPQNAPNQTLPQWARHPAEPESETAKPLTPSRQFDGDDVPAQSPANLAYQTTPTSQKNPYERGIMIHKLLEILPTLPSDKWQSGLQNYFAHHPQIPAPEQAEITTQILNILNHPDLSDMFTNPSAKSEMALTGTVGKHPILAYVDRVLITHTHIKIIDYKTNRTVPKTPPTQYVKQLALYEYLLKQLYPNHAINSYLVWTDTGTVMPLDKKTITDQTNQIINPKQETQS